LDEQNRKIRTVVRIGKNTYTVVGKESEQHVMEAADLVDAKIKEIKSKNPYLSSTQLAVLAALNISNDYVTVKKKLEDKQNEED
jgi:cell division protein ZapA